jgi:hypothetical protein
MSVYPVFQILGDNRHIQLILHFAYLTFLHYTVPLVPDVFPLHTDKLVMDFGRANVFLHLKIKSLNTSHNWHV